MAADPERIQHVRRFLNTDDHGGNAFIESEVNVSPGQVLAELKLGDCDRVVTLAFYASADNPDSVANLRYKLRTLLRITKQFADALSEELDSMEGQ